MLKYFSGQEYSGMNKVQFHVTGWVLRKAVKQLFSSDTLCLWAECSYCIPLTLGLSDHVRSQCRKLTWWKINLAVGEEQADFYVLGELWIALNTDLYEH